MSHGMLEALSGLFVLACAALAISYNVPSMTEAIASWYMARVEAQRVQAAKYSQYRAEFEAGR